MQTPFLPAESRLERLAPRFFLGTAYCISGLHLLTAVAKWYFDRPLLAFYGEVALTLAGLLLVLSYQGKGWPFYMSVPFVFYTFCGMFAGFLPAYYFHIGLLALLVQSVVFFVVRIRPRFQ